MPYCRISSYHSSLLINNQIASSPNDVSDMPLNSYYRSPYVFKILSAVSAVQQSKFVTVPFSELKINTIYRTFLALAFVLYSDEYD
jgi:hypothetical protein